MSILLNVAFISYEYPHETGGGGIGTFLEQQIYAFKGTVHKAIVICGTSKPEAYWQDDQVFRIPCRNANDFNQQILPFFVKLHQERQFNLIEGTDYLGWGLEIKEVFPKLKLIVRLHTPSYLIDSLQFIPLRGWHKLRFILGAFRKLSLPKLPKAPEIKDYLREFKILASADAIIAPSMSIRGMLINKGMLTEKKPFSVIPFGFSFSKQILSLAPKGNSEDIKVVYVGRLEIRKGVLELSDAIPEILKRHPNTTFTFVGQAGKSPMTQVDMDNFLKLRLSKFLSRITFTGKIPASEMIEYYDSGDIFVFPSHYESFGIACCEAMASAKAVVGSKNGGMAEIIEDQKSGLLVDPKKSDLVWAISSIIENQEQRLSLGLNARNRVLYRFNINDSTQNTIEFYLKTLNVDTKNT